MKDNFDFKYQLEKHTKLLHFLEKMNLSKPEGNLIIQNKNGNISYYQNINDETKGKNIRKYLNYKNIKLIKQLAQKSYFIKLKSVIMKNISLIKKLDSNIIDIDTVYENLSLERKNLVTPIEPTKQQKLDIWINTPYIHKDIYASGFTTNKREQVRSKSEKILADKFNYLEIPYKYECPLKIGSNILHPDFTFYNPETDEEIYWEHLGMIDNTDYLNNSIDRLQLFSSYNIVVNENLIISYETLDRPLNMKYVDYLISKFLKK
ncbi:hypothetical protein [Helcococcus bovis]|uniref:hypothetical protein n=1 Tax=Helcococcus bovis TaxID=3153252 RepID=UPI0038B85058